MIINKYFSSIVLLIMGLAFIAAGIMVGVFMSREALEFAERIETFTPSTISALRDMPPGREVLVEGQISPDNFLQWGNFVAYVSALREVDDDGDETWVEQERVTPPLSIILPEGALKIENDDYDMRGALNIETDGDIQYSGFQPGNAVIVLGALTTISDGIPHLEAEFIALGTYPEFVAVQRLEVQVLRWFGVVFWVVGVFLAFIGVAIWRR